jgi:hypothetical protein
MPFLSAFCKNNENEAEIFSEPCRDHGRSSLKNWAEKVQMMEFWKPNDVFSRGVNELLLATVIIIVIIIIIIIIMPLGEA